MEQKSGRPNKSAARCASSNQPALASTAAARPDPWGKMLNNLGDFSHGYLAIGQISTVAASMIVLAVLSVLNPACVNVTV